MHNAISHHGLVDRSIGSTAGNSLRAASDVSMENMQPLLKSVKICSLYRNV